MFDPVSSQLELYMNLLSARQRLVASNIANIDTPGYQTKDIDFHFEFVSQMGSNDPHAPTVVSPEGLIVKNDGNDVSLDREMRLLSENATRFSVAEALLKGQFNTLRQAIQEGGK